MFKTVLVPTDGSEHAKKVVLLATDIADKCDSRLANPVWGIRAVAAECRP